MLTKGSKCYIINLNEIYGQRKKIVCVCIFCQTFVSFWNQKVMSNLGTTAKGWISNKFGSFHAAWKSSWASKQTHFSALMPPETSSRLWPTFSSGSVEIHPLQFFNYNLTSCSLFTFGIQEIWQLFGCTGLNQFIDFSIIHMMNILFFPFIPSYFLSH